MTFALLALTGAVLMLAGVIALVAWWYLVPRWPQTLTDEEIVERLAPVVASKILTFASEDADPPIENWAHD